MSEDDDAREALGAIIAAEVATIRLAVDRIIATFQASPDAWQAIQDATALGELGKEMESGAAALRAMLAARLAADGGLSITELAEILGVSRSRAHQLVKAGRSKRAP